ncbi:hypothetical protein NE237_025746 [Protea cynaroides]|uniref:Uncharacterized protein n=1 Tax=Protea cynaroides TaxID=273540 RepID=A0A9Q0H3L5_9MAGN|nr:hypothetical protein NE237_025746 [Protea cynaroides]
MKPVLLVSLMLFLLVGVGQGIRVLQQEFSSGGYQKFHEENERSLIKESGGAGETVAVLCKDGHCSGKSRRLQNFSTSSTSTFSKSVKNSGGTKIKPTPNEENFHVESSSPISGHGKTDPEHYPDIIDIAGMDYSPATRKPPIHN